VNFKQDILDFVLEQEAWSLWQGGMEVEIKYLP